MATARGLISVYLKEYEEHIKTYNSQGDWKPRVSQLNVHLYPQIGNIPLNRVREADWELVLKKAHQRGLSYRQIKNVRGTMIHFCKFCKKNGYLQIIPEIEIQKYRWVKKENNILSVSDWKKLFSQEAELWIFRGKECECRSINFFRALLLSGWRPGEMVGLLRKNVDFVKKTVTISQAINVYGEITQGKTARALRTIYMPAQLERVLSKQFEDAKNIKSDYVFCNSDGSHLDQKILYLDWKRIVKCNNLTITSPYRLRHTLYSYSRHTVPEKALQDYMGHGEGMRSDDSYGHTVSMLFQQTAKDLEGLFEEVINNKEFACADCASSFPAWVR